MLDLMQDTAHVISKVHQKLWLGMTHKSKA